MAACPKCRKNVSILNHYLNFQNFRENMSRMGIRKVYNCDKCQERFQVTTKSSLWLNTIVMGLIFIFFLLPSYIFIYNGKTPQETMLNTMILLASLSLFAVFAGYFTWWKHLAVLIPDEKESAAKEAGEKQATDEGEKKKRKKGKK